MSLLIDLLSPLEFNFALARIARSAASGLLGRSRIDRSASALTNSTPSELARRETNVDLQLSELAALALEPVGPHMRAGLGRDELGVDLHLLAEAAHAAFEQIAHAKLAADLPSRRPACPCK